VDGSLWEDPISWSFLILFLDRRDMCLSLADRFVASNGVVSSAAGYTPHHC